MDIDGMVMDIESVVAFEGSLQGPRGPLRVD